MTKVHKIDAEKSAKNVSSGTKSIAGDSKFSLKGTEVEKKIAPSGKNRK